MKPFLSVKFFSDWIASLRETRKPDQPVVDIHDTKAQNAFVSNDVNAAIAMALYLHFDEMHDEESNVITIQRISKTYSPWSSKIYNMRNFR